MRRKQLRIIGLCLFLVVLLGAGCKKKTPPAPPTPPPPPPAAAPTATLAANPTSIERGQSSTLNWTSTNATEVALEPDIGAVPASGSRAVQPTESTTFRLMAKGPGGSVQATARVTVTSPPPPPPPTPPPSRGPAEEELFLKQVRPIYFDYDKADIREDQRPALQANGEFLRAYPSILILIEGHCDERGSAEYNLGLGDLRANSAKEFLVSMGIAPERIRTISYGKERPVCTEANEDCWQRNRRAMFLMSR